MKYAPLTLALFALAACNSDRTTAPNANDPSVSLSRGGFDRDNDSDRDDRNHDNGPGVVVTLSNEASGNALLVFKRQGDGSLVAAGSVPTGGNGSGAGLGSANAVVYSPDGDLLFAVNAGSNTVSSFRAHGTSFTLVSTMSSGGTHPISLTASRGLLYVLNDGGNGNIAGLRYTSSGKLFAMPLSSRALSSNASAPAQIQFTEDGRRLVVSEKGTNMLGTYTVGFVGLATNGTFSPSAGQTPFGFATRGEDIIVSEAFGGAVNASTVSSYRVGHFGAPTVISAAVPTTETAACWVAVTGNGRYAYAANTGSGTITGYAVSKGGALSILDANGETAVQGPGTAPADVAMSRNSTYLYVRNGGNASIGAMRVHGNGSLTVLSGGIAGLPAHSVGLAAQ